MAKKRLEFDPSTSHLLQVLTITLLGGKNEHLEKLHRAIIEKVKSLAKCGKRPNETMHIRPEMQFNCGPKICPENELLHQESAKPVRKNPK